MLDGINNNKFIVYRPTDRQTTITAKGTLINNSD